MLNFRIEIWIVGLKFLIGRLKLLISELKFWILRFGIRKKSWLS